MSLDLDAIKARLAEVKPEHYQEGDRDIAALIAEVERLRELATDLIDKHRQAIVEAMDWNR